MKIDLTPSLTHWGSVKEIFQAAVELTPDARPDFLANACADQNALRVEVEKMLTAHDRAGNFLETSAFGDLREENEKRTNKRLGPYRILRQIGAGGMGVVYLAERADGQFEQCVAIKILRHGLDTVEMLRRFHTERQILATLDHPNIARLVDGGTTDDGLPYYAMEYVEGRSIDDYCKTHGLSIPERLALFRTVCAAVHHAHQKMVIHRDLKPSNILVTEGGVVKLLDFGIAKLMTNKELDPLATATGYKLMTPAYASPEQVRGDNITIATDVYALGMIFYELLAGRRPYDFASGRQELLTRSMRDTEPSGPSAAVALTSDHPLPELQRQLRGDLDNIALTALRKDPQTRYRSAEQFSEDIRRYLAGLPVLARPQTLRYRTVKLFTRNPRLAIAVSLLFFTLCGGVITSWTHARLARRQRAVAERRFNDLRQLANSLVFDYSDAIAELPRSTRVRARMVRDVTEYLDRLACEVGDDRPLQLELAHAYLKVGDVQVRPSPSNLGATESALQSYQKALSICEEINQHDPSNVEAQKALGMANVSIGLIQTRLRRMEHQ